MIDLDMRIYKKNKCDSDFWANARVITNRDIRNGAGEVIPKGSICTVEKKYRGLEIHWGDIWISRVKPESVELLEKK